MARPVSDPDSKTTALRDLFLTRSTIDDDISAVAISQASPQLVPWSFKVSADHEPRDCAVGTGKIAPRADGITVALLEAFWPHIDDRAMSFYKGCILSGYYPSCFSQVQVILLPKPSRDPIFVKG